MIGRSKHVLLPVQHILQTRISKTVCNLFEWRLEIKEEMYEKRGKEREGNRERDQERDVPFMRAEGKRKTKEIVLEKV